MKEIYLKNKNLITYVDDEDHEKLLGYTWYAWKKNEAYSTYYAVTDVWEKGTQTRIYMHRLILAPKYFEIVDHIDRKGLNNTRNNLRICSYSLSQLNRGLQSNNKSGVKGVFFDKRREKWNAEIGINGKAVYLGAFPKFEDAVDARKTAEIANGLLPYEMVY